MFFNTLLNSQSFKK